MVSRGDKRISFKKGEQRTFILRVKNQMGFNWEQLSGVVSVHDRTLRDWAREKYGMPYQAACIMGKKASVPIPHSFEVYDWGKHLKEASRKGGKATWQKYGRIGTSSKLREKKWQEWWLREGQFKHHAILERKDIDKPIRSKQLAEFVGIILGDGGISNYQVTVTLHAIDDKMYGDFVTSLIKKLFNVPVGIHKSKKDKSVNYYVSRAELVDFCVESLGLVKGNKVKQQVDIPKWVKKNNSFAVACVRGLVDTDGCVFTHTYKVAGKRYSYKKLGFTSQSRPLLKSVASILESNGLKVRFAKGCDIRIDSKEGMEHYMRYFGSHNPKHLRRYEE